MNQLVPASGTPEQCQSCIGTGEVGSENGPVGCPDCGGVGFLPSPHVLVEWRARDIELAQSGGSTPAARDIRWLLAELRRARGALTEISSLANELEDDAGIATRIRFTANTALRLYDVTAEKKG
jgi:predicted  nucleic acid-binding Zn-ribbon protein